MWEVFKQGPAVVIDAVVLQDEQLAYVPGSDVTGNFYCSAGVIFIINFDYLQQQHRINKSIHWEQNTFYLERAETVDFGLKQCSDQY